MRAPVDQRRMTFWAAFGSLNLALFLWHQGTLAGVAFVIGLVLSLIKFLQWTHYDRWYMAWVDSWPGIPRWITASAVASFALGLLLMGLGM